MPAPPSTPAQRLAIIVLRLVEFLDGRSMFGPFPRPLALLICDRLRTIQRRIRSLADRIAAGTYVPRRAPAARRRHGGEKPGKPDPLPRDFGWLKQLEPRAIEYAGHLDHLLRDPAMAALMAAAPTAMRRPLRSLCRMLGVTPPPILNRESKALLKNLPSATPEREGAVAGPREGEGAPAARHPARPKRRAHAPPSPILPLGTGPPRPA